MKYSREYRAREFVASVGRILGNTRLRYVGGIHVQEQVEEMSIWADAVVVDNAG